MPNKIPQIELVCLFGLILTLSAIIIFKQTILEYSDLELFW